MNLDLMFFFLEKKKTELYQELGLQARDLRFQHLTSITARNNAIIIRMEVWTRYRLLHKLSSSLCCTSYSFAFGSWRPFPIKGLVSLFIDLFLVSQGCGDTAEFTGAGFPWSRSGEMAGVRTWGTAGGRWKFGYLLTALWVQSSGSHSATQGEHWTIVECIMIVNKLLVLSND